MECPFSYADYIVRNNKFMDSRAFIESICWNNCYSITNI